MRRLRHPLINGVKDLARLLHYDQERRHWLCVGKLEAALMAEAKQVRSVQFARESLRTYRRIDRFINAHPDQIGGHRPDDQQPTGMVFFVGQSRSGHSLVGSLIDAHPEAVIAHEIHAMKHLLNGAEFEEVVRAIKLNAHLFDALGRGYTGYDYAVPGQFQGRYQRLKLIGDKKGNGTTRLLRRRPESVAWLQEALPIPMRFINVIRNPFDNIATKAMRTGVSLQQASRIFFANAATHHGLTSRHGHLVKTVYLEALIAKPTDVLEDLIAWLGLSTAPGYLEDCASLVFDRPKRTGRDAPWPVGLIDAIRWELGRFPALACYADDVP